MQIAKANRVEWCFGKPRMGVSKLSSLEELFAGRHFDREAIRTGTISISITILHIRQF